MNVSQAIISQSMSGSMQSMQTSVSDVSLDRVPTDIPNLDDMAMLQAQAVLSPELLPSCICMGSHMQVGY